ncbi:MAG: NAD(P)-dependent alcohol dehydrogenase [Saprospiraceae bacterium]|nr:NAD(P)-dependent alcohol dehydrogenase [Saprospiraceae bacterium]
MKAIVYHKYGSPADLHYAEIPCPVPDEKEILVKVRAASINSWDLDLLRGKPFLARLGGIFKPRYQVLGADIAGTVEAVGREVTDWKVGDAVYGDISESGWGGFAEYVKVKANALAPKPHNISFEEAAAIPQAAVLAWSGLHISGAIPNGLSILLIGAGGGVGTFGIQIAKHFGATVTAIDRPEKLDFMRALGADKVIDYTEEDFSRRDLRYDLILDVVSYRPLSEYRNALKANGRYVVIGGSTPAILRLFFIAPLYTLYERISGQQSGKKMQLLFHRPDPEILQEMSGILNNGIIKAMIDRTYPLPEVPEAMNYFMQGKVKGKIVIKIPE